MTTRLPHIRSVCVTAKVRNVATCSGIRVARRRRVIGYRLMTKTASGLQYKDVVVGQGKTPGPGQTYYMEGYYRPSILPNGAVDTSTASVDFDGSRFGRTEQDVTAP